ncbi:MAG: GDP-mannose 4,6-dehydratase [Acidimicrobiales bacterium]
MHTLVTGGAGFLGSALVERLLAEGHTVDVVDNLSCGSLWNLAEARASSGRDLTFHQLDVRSPDVGDLIVRRSPEVVWHLAGHDDVESANASPAADADANIVGSLRMLEAVRAADTRKLVVASSAGVYGETGEEGATETSPRQPRSAHAIAKHTVDAYLAAFAEIDSSVFTSLVVANVYGPRASSGVVAAWAECLIASRACTVFGRGDQVRDFVYVDDVVDALARAAERADGMILNIGTGTPTSLADLHATMIELAAEIHAASGDELDPAARLRGPALGVRQGPARPGDIHRSVLNPARAVEALGWAPWTSLRDGLATVVRAAAHPRP